MKQVIILFLFFSCQEKYSVEKCNEISMQRFKGLPHASSEFDKHCVDVNIHYTKETCQNALNDLIVTTKLSQVKKKYGDSIDHCFTGDDLMRFNKE